MATRWLISQKWWDGRAGHAQRLYDPVKRYQGKQESGVIDLPNDWKPPQQLEIALNPDDTPKLDEDGNIIRTEVKQEKMIYMGYVDPETGTLNPGRKPPGAKKK